MLGSCVFTLSRCCYRAHGERDVYISVYVSLWWQTVSLYHICRQFLCVMYVCICYICVMMCVREIRKCMLWYLQNKCILCNKKHCPCYPQTRIIRVCCLIKDLSVCVCLSLSVRSFLSLVSASVPVPFSPRPLSFSFVRTFSLSFSLPLLLALSSRMNRHFSLSTWRPRWVDKKIRQTLFTVTQFTNRNITPGQLGDRRGLWLWRLKNDNIQTPMIMRTSMSTHANTWWLHQMETYSALLAICAGNSPAHGELPVQRPVTQSFDVFFDLRPNKRLSKQWWGWWFEMPSRPLWRHRNV